MADNLEPKFLIICIASQPWDSPLKTNRHYMMRYLAQQHQVLFVESLGLRTPKLSRADISKLLLKLFHSLLGARKTLIESLFALDPLILPVSLVERVPFLEKLNRLFLLFQIKVAIRKLDSNLPRVLWSYVPSAMTVAGKLGESLLIYDCVDNYQDVPGFAKKLVEQDIDLAGQADLIFALSRPIEMEKRKLNKNVIYAPGGANPRLFQRAMDSDTVVAEDIANIPRPILGYVGNFADHKQDFELLEKLAQADPMWSVVLIGPIWSGGVEVDSALSKLQKMPNVFWLGRKAHQNLPSYLKAFNVCLLPQKENVYSHNSFPMKLFEYLGSGKPVVSTWVESLVDFDDYIWLARNQDQFIEGIRHYLANDSREEQKRRVALAQEYSWEHRVEILKQGIYEAFSDKGDLNWQNS